MRFSQNEAEQIRKEYQEGATIEQLLAKWLAEEKTIWRVINKVGGYGNFEKRCGRLFSTEEALNIYKEYREMAENTGLSDLAIQHKLSEKYFCSHGTIANVMYMRGTYKNLREVCDK